MKEIILCLFLALAPQHDEHVLRIAREAFMLWKSGNREEAEALLDWKDNFLTKRYAEEVSIELKRLMLERSA